MVGRFRKTRGIGDGGVTDDMSFGAVWRTIFATAGLTWLALVGEAWSGPVETSVFAVQGVPVDVTSTDATAARNQALMDVQVKAFYTLVNRLGSAQMAQDLAKLKPTDIAPYLKSLSIEQETSAPGRYIGTFTVRFLPAKMVKLFEGYGFHVPTVQAPAILLLPIYRDATASQMWEDNVWRKAWLDLKAEQSLVPIIIPLGDLEDTETLGVEDALNGDPIKLEALRRRYDAPSLIVAIAEPAEGGGIHVMMNGDTKLGRITIDKVYTGDDATLPGSAAAAAGHIDELLVDKYKENAQKAVVASRTPQSMAVSVPFSSPTEWNRIRSRILSTPYVTGVDVSTLSTDGAVIKLTFTNALDLLQSNMGRTGLNLSEVGGSWVIQPM